MMVRFLILLAVLFLAPTVANAQLYPDRYGYAWYPRQYAPGYYRAPYYGGGLPYRGYNGYHMHDPAPGYGYRAPMHYAAPPRYDYRGYRSGGFVWGAYPRRYQYRGGGWW
jgi:hypothetical protein